MLTRSRKKSVALLALIALMFAALMPAASSLARTLDGSQVVALGGICSTAYDTSVPAAPADNAGVHRHCVFCASGTPLVSAPRLDTLLARLDAPASVWHAHHNDALPCDVVAVHPLSPRAPPRAL